MMERASQIAITFLANGLWQIALLAIAVSCCERLARRHSSAKSRHRLWVAALILSVALPLLSLHYSGESGRLYFASTRNTADALPALVSRIFHFVSQRPRPIFMSEQFARLLLYGYGVSLIYRLGRFGVIYRRTAVIRRTANVKPVPEIFAALLQHLQRSFGIRGEPAVLISAQDGPMTCGLGSPVIVVPEALLAETSPSVITSVLGHELAHIRRHDFLLNLIYEVLFLPISFHPAAWLMRQRLEQTRELACDEMIAGPLLDPPTYARSLFSVIRSLSACKVHSCGLGSAGTKKLEERFEAILSHRPRRRSAWTLWLASFVVVAVVFIAARFRFTFIPRDPASLTASAVSIPEARSIALRYMPGEVVGEEISRKKGDLLYSFYVRTQADISEVYVRAASGEVARVNYGEHAHHEMAH
jgi:beta-lactamase regulating signal transducer with metallopeptidase domain